RHARRRLRLLRLTRREERAAGLLRLAGGYERAARRLALTRRDEVAARRLIPARRGLGPARARAVSGRVVRRRGRRGVRRRRRVPSRGVAHQRAVASGTIGAAVFDAAPEPELR